MHLNIWERGHSVDIQIHIHYSHIDIVEIDISKEHDEGEFDFLIYCLFIFCSVSRYTTTLSSCLMSKFSFFSF